MLCSTHVLCVEYMEWYVVCFVVFTFVVCGVLGMCAGVCGVLWDVWSDTHFLLFLGACWLLVVI